MAPAQLCLGFLLDARDPCLQFEYAFIWGGMNFVVIFYLPQTTLTSKEIYAIVKKNLL
jgi:hypothetical protein